MTLQELAKYFKTGVSTICNFAKEGKIPATELEPKHASEKGKLTIGFKRESEKPIKSKIGRRNGVTK